MNGIQEVVGSIPISSTKLLTMPFNVYVLKSEKSGRSYIGHTADLPKRLVEHTIGKSKATRGKGPWRLVYHEEFVTRAEAVARERYFKTVEGRSELKERGILRGERS